MSHPLSRILVSLVVVIAVAAAALAYRSLGNQQHVKTQNSSAAATSATIRIDSIPSGLAMQGAPKCDSIQLKKTTPYDCDIGSTISTVITAPEQVFSGGKTYNFKTWDGCSASNTDHKICKVDARAHQTKTIKSTYELYKPQAITQSPGSPPSDPVTTCSPISYTDYPHGGCGILQKRSSKLLVKTSFAPECDSWRAGIETRCRNQVSYYSGTISPSVEFWCDSDPRTPCGFADPYATNTLIPGQHIIRLPGTVTFSYSLGAKTGLSAQAILGNAVGIYDKQTNTIIIDASYVTPLKDETYPKCCTP